VECEEKQWRGQRITQPPVQQAPVPLQSNQPQSPELKQSIPDKSAQEIDKSAQEIFIQDSHPDQLSMPLLVESEAAVAVPKSEVTKIPQEVKPVASSAVEATAPPQSLATTSVPSSSDAGANAPADALSSNEAALFLSSALQSESWFASNKYVLMALLVVALVIGGIAWLR
jgi:hypothetical protein